MKFQRIAIAVDGSPNSRLAIDLASRLVKGYRPRLTLISVVSTTPEISLYPELARPLIERLREKAQRYLEEARREVVSYGFEADTALLEGYPPEEICSFLDGKQYQLVVMGSRGLGEHRIHPIGSVSYNVAQFAKTSVLVARGNPSLRKILLPHDGSEAAAGASKWAEEIAQLHKASIMLLYVIPQGTDEVKFTVTRGVGEPFLGPVVEALNRKGISASRRVEYGHPSEIITTIAEDEKFDLILLGAQGRGGSMLGLGGVTDRVLRFAPCSTLVVR